MQKFFYALTMFVLTVAGFAAPWVDPALTERLRSSDAMVTAVAQFHDAYGFSINGASPQQIQRQKMRNSAVSQSAFFNYLDRHYRNSDEVSTVSLWICNVVIIKAKAEIISQMTDREDLKALILDYEISLFPEQPSRGSELNEDAYTYGLKKVRAMEVWEKFGLRGEDVVVGILDTGWADHPELNGRVLKSRDFISDYEDNQPNDGQGHGSHCMGSIGGGDLSGKHIGVAPKVKFIVGKIFNDSGSTTSAAILQAMQWMADPDGNPATADQPRVVSNSWGGGQQSLEKEKPQWDAVTTWRQLGMVPVVAAGNSGPSASTVGTPGGFPHSFCIGATDSKDRIARFSSRGPISWEGVEYIKPDVSAPGVDIYSIRNTGGYTNKSGTSMATPHVAGVVALMLQADPEIPVRTVEEILMSTAVELGDPGKDNFFGTGRVDAYEAVSLVLSGGRAQIEVDCGEAGAEIVVQPGNRRYTTDKEGHITLFLPAGKYMATVSAFGYLPVEREIEIVSKEIVQTSIELEKAPNFEVSFEVRNQEGTLLNARVDFLDVPLQGGETSGDVFSTVIPGGRYQAQIIARGYQSRILEFSLTSSKEFEVVMEDLPPVLIVDDDAGKDYHEYYESCMKRLGIDYDILEKTVSVDRLLGYAHVIWLTGSASSKILSAQEMAMLEKYVRGGGRLLITGQDIGYSLKNESFYKEILGAKYVKDTSKMKSIEGQGLSFSLDGADSAGNQRYPDVIEKADDTAEVLFSYTGKGPAVLLHPVELGLVAYMAFGFEGISGQDNRDAVMQILLKMLKPDVTTSLERIGWAWENARTAYHVLIRSFEVQESNQKEVRSFLESRQDKTPYRVILQQLRMLQ